MRKLHLKTIIRNVKINDICYSQLDYYTRLELIEKGYCIMPIYGGYKIVSSKFNLFY